LQGGRRKRRTIDAQDSVGWVDTGDRSPDTRLGVSDDIDLADELADIVQRAHGIEAAIFGTLETLGEDTIKGAHALYLDHLQSLKEFKEHLQENREERSAVDQAGGPR
jgi:hypothetical protein